MSDEYTPSTDEVRALYDERAQPGEFDRWFTEMFTSQFRAIFSYPPSILGTTPDSYGPWRDLFAEAENDRPPRSEETHGWRSGIEARFVSKPERV